MDGVAPTQEASSSKRPLFYAIIAVFVLAWFAFWINYFGVINLNQYLPFLPSKSPQTTPPSTPSSKLTLSCPVPKEFCATGEKILDNKGLNAIGFSLPVGTPIYATFSGEAEILEAGSDSRTIKKHPVIRINGTGDQQGYVAHYAYFGQAGSNLSTHFAKGEKVGSAGTGSFPNDNTFFGVNLLFYITAGKTNIIPVTPENFTP